MIMKSGSLQSPRLTDNDIEQSGDANKAGGRANQQAESRSESDTEDRIAGPIDTRKLLPEYLIHSLYKAQHEKEKRETMKLSSKRSPYPYHREDQSSSTIKNLNDKLKLIGHRLDDSSFLSIMEGENSRWEPRIDFGRRDDLQADLGLSKIDSGKHTGHKQTKTVCMQMLDEKTKNIKDVNLNINLNLRVLGDKNGCSTEYDCFIPRGMMLKSGKDKPGSDYKPSTEFKRLTKSRKLLGSSIRHQFKKKAKPDEVRVSSKDFSAESRMLRKQNIRSHGRIDSENSLSQRKFLPNSLPISSLQIQNFSNLFAAIGSSEYKKVTSRSIRTRKSRNLENILTKYKSGTEKTAEPESGKKDKSDKKTVTTARSRIGGSAVNEFMGSQEPLLSARATEGPGSKASSKSKVNFKRKKMSIQQQSQQNLHNLSKEGSRQGYNMDAVTLYQTNNYRPVKKSSQKPSRNSDPIELIKEKYNGSISGRTQPTQGESSGLNNIVQSIGVKHNSHKLSLSNSIANYTLSQLKTLGIMTGQNLIQSQLYQTNNGQTAGGQSAKMLQTRGDSKELKLSLSKHKKETRSRSKSGQGQKQAPASTFPIAKINRMLDLEIKKKPDLQELGIKKVNSSRGHLLRPPTSDRERKSFVPASTVSNGVVEKISRPKAKINFANFERLHTAHGYSRSEMRSNLFTNPIQPPPGLQRSKVHLSTSASKTPSIHISGKIVNK